MKEQDQTVYGNITRGISWSVSMRWVMRLSGLVSVAILARLLHPEDFALIAIASLATGFLSIIVDFGTTMQVIRSDRTDRDFLDSAWTLNLIQWVFLGVCFLAAAPLAASFFGREELSDLIAIFAASAVVSGFANIGVVLFRRELDFAADFRFETITKMGTIGLTIALAFLLRNFWALALGQLAGAFLRVVFSYGMHSYRPRLSITLMRQFFNFTITVTTINIGKYFLNRFDLIVAGRVLDMHIVGLYSVASELASHFTQEITLPVARAMFPNYAAIKNDVSKLLGVFLSILRLLAIVLFPIGFGLATVAEELVAVVFGPQWYGAAALLQWLGPALVLKSLAWVMGGNILIVSGHEKVAALTAICQVLLVCPLFAVSGFYLGVEGIAIACLVGGAVTLATSAMALIYVFRVSPLRLFDQLWAAAISASIMAIAVRYMPLYLDSPVQLLLLKIPFGVVVYTAVVAFLWVLCGRRDVVEKKIVNAIWQRLFS